MYTNKKQNKNNSVSEWDHSKGGNVTKTVKEISPKKINEQESFLEKGIYINTFKIL
jgi:hypothetical protein